MSITAFGDATKTVFLNEAESHKLHIAFTAAVAIKKGQPVKLTDDDTVGLLIGDGTDSDHIVGYSIQNAEAGDQVTIAMKGYAVIFAMSGGAVTVGPVRYSGVNSGDAMYMNYVDAKTTNLPKMNGQALDSAAGANEIIRVVLQ